MLFVFFPCLFALASTSGALLNRSDQSGHPCLLLDLRGKAFTLPKVSCGILINGLYYVEKIFFYAYFVENFLSSNNKLCQMLFLYPLRWLYGFSL